MTVVYEITRDFQCPKMDQGSPAPTHWAEWERRSRWNHCGNRFGHLGQSIVVTMRYAVRDKAHSYRLSPILIFKARHESFALAESSVDLITSSDLKPWLDRPTSFIHTQRP